MGINDGMILTGENERTRRKACPNVTLSTDPTCNDPDANPELRSERPATNRLSHGMAKIIFIADSRLVTGMNTARDGRRPGCEVNPFYFTPLSITCPLAFGEREILFSM
jgi:hypothetical protein